ncbi:MAG: protocatechuate 3,4-dioxygenase [Bdellovibrionota bacterium]
MANHDIMNRRKLLQGISALSLGSVGASALSQALCKIPTAQQTEGPFYPVEEQEDEDFDLTRVAGHREGAKGEKIKVRGLVQDQNCLPVAGALVEVWQACHSGRYNHPSDPNTGVELDPNFQYWGRAISAEDGSYQFLTIRPGQYPASDTWIRPSHIHFKIQKRGYRELTTQMYFAGDRYNASDLILNELTDAEKDAVIVDFQEDANETYPVGTFDIVIEKL